IVLGSVTASGGDGGPGSLPVIGGIGGVGGQLTITANPDGLGQASVSVTAALRGGTGGVEGGTGGAGGVARVRSAAGSMSLTANVDVSGGSGGDRVSNVTGPGGNGGTVLVDF